MVIWRGFALVGGVRGASERREVSTTFEPRAGVCRNVQIFWGRATPPHFHPHPPSPLPFARPALPFALTLDRARIALGGLATGGDGTR